MDTKVLVTYASKYGSTAEMAEKVAEVIRQTNLQTDVMPMKEVSNLNPYSVVVLGSALYVGRWRKAARKFLKRYEHKLAGRDVWVFLSGPTGEADKEGAREAWHLSKKLERSLEHIKPRDIRVFRGAIDVNKLSNLEKWMIKQVKAPTGDFRDWDVITTWAKGIADEVKVGDSQKEQLAETSI